MKAKKGPKKRAKRKKKLRRKQCDGKIKHKTEQDAKYARSLVPMGSRPMDAYRCQHCGFFHIGHTIRKGIR